MVEYRGVAGRRAFMLKVAGAAAGAAFAAPAAAVDLPAAITGKCGTCEFWGGARKISADGSAVVAEGRGTCNNQASPAYRKQTEPTQGAPAAWKRWAALDTKS